MSRSLDVRANKTVTTAILDDVYFKLNRASTCMQSFSQQLRQVYSQDESRMAVETLAYREGLRFECQMYGSLIFPITVQLFENVKDMLEDYTLQNFEDFREGIDDLRSVCLKFSKRAAIVQTAHGFVLTNLKALENRMNARIATLTGDERTCRTNSVRAKDNATKMKMVGGGIAMITPAVAGLDGGMGAVVGGLIAGGSVIIGATQERAADRHLEAAENASQNIVTLKSLRGSLRDFNETVDEVAKFVTILEVELREMSAYGVGGDFVKRHYNKMRGKAGGLIERCVAFLQIKMAVQTDLASVGGQLDFTWRTDWEQRLAVYTSQRTIDEAGKPSQRSAQGGSHRISWQRFEEVSGHQYN